MQSIKIMAEEMHKERKKAFELQEKMDKLKKTKAKEGKKWKKGSVSGPPDTDNSVVQEVQVMLQPMPLHVDKR